MLVNPFFLFLVDLAIGSISYALAWFVRMHLALPLTQALLPQERWGAVEHFWVTLVLSQVFFLYILGLYDDLRVLRYREILTFTLAACALQVVALTSLFYFTNGVFPRSVILLFGCLNFLGLSLWRVSIKRKLQKETLRVLVVGESLDTASGIAREIERHPWMGLNVVGLAVGEGDVEWTGSGPEILGNLSQAKELVEKYEIEEIIFASRETWKDRVLDSITQLQLQKPLRIAIQPSVYEIAIGRLRHVNIHDTPLIEVRRTPNEPFERFFKRSFDFGLSALCVLVVLPVALIVALLIALFAPGPVFYRQDRVGRGGRVFQLIKFRTMIPDAERDSGETYSSENDPRVTGIGAVLRRFRLDELPQLINVLKGDMSFVGPRPERPVFVEQFAVTVPGYHERHKVKPGITGLAQVRGYYDTPAEKKLKYDLAYIYNHSFSLDLMILLETLKVVLVRKGS